MPAIDDPMGMAASIPGQLADLKRVVKDLSVNRTFSPNLFAVGAGGLTVAGPTTLTGGVAGPVAATGQLSGAGLSITSGNMFLSGGGSFFLNGTNITNLYVPLANQVAASGYTLTTSFSAVASFAFTVPAGCTRALVSASGSLTASTTYAGTDVVHVMVQINGVNGPESRAPATSTLVPCVPASSTANLSGLTPGGAFSLFLYGYLTNGPGTSILSAATLSATALFLP